MENTESKLRELHNHLSVVLSEHITEVQFAKLKQIFRLSPFGDGTLEKIKGFYELWNILETTKKIGIGRYDYLEKTFESIQASCHNDVIKEFKERMRSEGATNNGWVRHENTLTRAECDIAVVEYTTSMERLGPSFGTVHIFENAVFSLIPRSGGELGLKNGTAKLEIPSGAIQNKDQELFWIFRPPADAEGSHLAICPQEQSLNNIDFVKYSLPVTLGPPDVAFHETAHPILFLKEYSFPYSTNVAAPLSIYRRTGDNGTWERVGSCFLVKESGLVIVPLAKFSSYVIGLPVTSELLPLNVHIMVQRLPKKKNDTSKRCDMQVVFSMNDHTYIQEMVLRKRMNIVCETSYYLDPKSDVNIRCENRNTGGSVYPTQTAVLEKGRLNRLAEKMQSVTIPIQDEQQLVEDGDILVILEQHDTDLVELLCRDDRPMKKEEITPKRPLPKLPVPDLASTLQKYLSSVEHLIPEEQYEVTQALVADFGRPGGEGELLQEKLKQVAEIRDNWVSFAAAEQIMEGGQNDSQEMSVEAISASSASSAQNTDDEEDSDSKYNLSYKERRREAHTHAEQKRRDAIKKGYDDLQALVPTFQKDDSLSNSKISKATVLQKSIDYIQFLIQQKKKQEEELDSLRKEVMALKIMKANYEHIVKAHKNTPVSGQNQVSDEIKFNVFQQVMDGLFQSFNATISVANFAELSGCVFSWLEEYCKPQSLREVVLTILRRVNSQLSNQQL